MPKGSKALLCLFKTYVTYEELEINQNRIGADLMTVLYNDFNASQFTSEASYCILMLDHASASLVQQATPASNAPHPKSGKALSMDRIDIFHQEWSKSIKHDTNPYTIFKEDHKWESWHREFPANGQYPQRRIQTSCTIIR
jgi:hypothetical protein